MAIDLLAQDPRETLAANRPLVRPASPREPRPSAKGDWKSSAWLTGLDLILALALWNAARAIGSWPFENLLFAPFLAGLLVTGSLGGAYDLRKLRRPRSRWSVGARQVFGGLVPVCVFGVLAHPTGLGGWTGLVLGGFLVWLGYVAARPPLSAAILSWTGREKGPVERVLVVGSGRAAVRAARSLVEDAGEELHVLGFADSEIPSPLPPGFPAWRVGCLDEVPELAAQAGADQVLMVKRNDSGEQVVRLTDYLRRRGIRLRVVSNVFHRLVESVPFEHIDGLPVMEVGATPLRGFRQILKRAFDLAGAVIGSIVILPLIAGIALAIRLTSPGPVLYKQTRLGRGGKPFTFYKFRSMIQGRNEVVHERYVEQLVTNGAAAGAGTDGKPVYKYVDGSRLTPLGRWLRRTSLDELPQLINVIRGEMSLVGPRPCVPFEYGLYKDWQKGRLDVTPGMTGLWQVTGRSFVTFEDMVLMDLFYIANWSFLLDLKLLARTVPVVMWGKGGL